MSNATRDQVLALAGVIQGALLVSDIARSGWPPPRAAALEASLASVLQFDAEDTAGVFGGSIGLSAGLRGLQGLLEGGSNSINPDAVRYGLAAMKLERSLAASPPVVRALGEQLRALKQRLGDAPLTDESSVTQMADVYQATLSTLKFRVQVFGTPELLDQTPVANGIRACLLATVRAAWVWRQRGGRRWHLVLQRGSLRRELERL